MSLRSAILLSMLVLAGCASAGPAAPVAANPGEVDTSCAVDSDCEVKNVGSCCGYRPACVNRDSPTFPDRVRAACAKSGSMSICGFPDIQSCRCVQKRCAAVESTP